MMKCGLPEKFAAMTSLQEAVDYARTFEGIANYHGLQ